MDSGATGEGPSQGIASSTAGVNQEAAPAEGAIVYNPDLGSASTGTSSTRSFDLASFLSGLPSPTQLVMEIGGGILLTIALVLVWKHKEAVMILLTGDPTVHGSLPGSFYWCFFQCCGICHHEWTRCLTQFSCCPRRIRGANLVRWMGSSLGLTTYSVELSNIVVGDLPRTRRSNFFLSVECSSNPAMLTSIAEDKHPKVVHYPEVLTLRIRDHLLAPTVKIVAKELTIVGSRDLCEIEFATTNVIDWCNERTWSLDSQTTSHNNVRRFAMKPLVDEAVETPPWIALEFSHAVNDARYLEGMPDYFHTVRTASWNGTGASYVDHNVSETKRQYRLVDGDGAEVDEPLESDLFGIWVFAQCLGCIYMVLQLITLVVVFGFLVMRFYVERCFIKYRRLTIAKLKGKRFPIGLKKLEAMMNDCHNTFDGTGLVAGNTTCRPTASEVSDVCHVMPPGQPRPRLQLMPPKKSSQTFGFELPTFPCAEEACHLHDVVAPWDLHAFALAGFLMIFVFCCCRSFVDHAIMNKQKASGRKRRQMAS